MPKPHLRLAPDKKGTDVGCPVGHARGAKAQALGDLSTQRFPVGGHIARPGDGGVTLLPQKGRTGEIDNPFCRSHLPLPLVHAL